MRRFVDRMIRGLGPAFAMLLVLAFAAPAFAAHVCAESEACAPSAQAAIETPSDADPACPDCGPACANGCCHAPHVATAPELAAPTAPLAVARTGTWLQAAVPPPVRPAGPDRPPRA